MGISSQSRAEELRAERKYVGEVRRRTTPFWLGVTNQLALC